MTTLMNWLATTIGSTLFGAVVTFTFGLIALVIGALINACLNRRRDDRLRAEEAKAVSAALYGEILLMRRSVAKAAQVVANTFFGYGRKGVFDEHILELIALKDPQLYPALASKLGFLPPDTVLAITKFHADYEAVREWVPKLVERPGRGFSYGVLFVLRPARNAVYDINPALRNIEMLLNIRDAAEDPDMKVALEVIDIEETIEADDR
ncbi:hypothetical protein ELH97_06305 [Rhizobium leguminosarum]|uniref:hypothetical protein n=1 Tax=Rhizobium leguminosarum TaxID=384 RepID=UPI0010303CA5|nr:hypothetical protein [Rhizobium leguminosarum]TAX91559.1 hypothetical protein ELH97_06305 [Rhizobium leguminosarum]